MTDRGATFLSTAIMCLILGWGPIQTNAQDVASAVQAYELGRLDEASAALQGALESGGLSSVDLARVHRLLGILAVASGESDVALEAFQRSLALNPSQETPAELSPEDRSLFDGIRAGRAGQPCQVEFEAVGPVIMGRALSLEAQLVGAPDELAASFEVRVMIAGGEPWTATSESGSLTVAAAAWRGARRLRVQVSARDPWGNTVASRESELASEPQPEDDTALSAAIAPNSEEPETAARPLRRNPWLWITLGVVVAGAAAGAGVWAARRPVQGRIVFGE